MKWVSHIAIAGATMAIYDPKLVPLSVFGGVFPDLAENIGNNFLRMRIQHRQQTHYFAYWLFGTIAFYIVGVPLAFAFCWGGFTHILADATTITGVPFSPMSDRRFHLFGGRLRTGSHAEYMFVFVFTVACVFLAHFLHRENTSFVPFFFNWGEYYENGLIDAIEWKENRFKFF